MDYQSRCNGATLEEARGQYRCLKLIVFCKMCHTAVKAGDYRCMNDHKCSSLVTHPSWNRSARCMKFEMEMFLAT